MRPHHCELREEVKSRRVFLLKAPSAIEINMAGVIPAIFASSLLLARPLWRVGLAAIRVWTGCSPGTVTRAALVHHDVCGWNHILQLLLHRDHVRSERRCRQPEAPGRIRTGIRPGQQTSKYIDDVITRLIVAGALYVTLV